MGEGLVGKNWRYTFVSTKTNYMKFYNVNIAGVQKHIQGNSFENQTAGQVSCIIIKYWDDEYCTMPNIDNTMWQALSNDWNIEITEAI